MTIQDLKRNDIFKFNDEEYKVARKWIDDGRPLVAILRYGLKKHWFYYEGLEIEKINPHAATVTAK
jgi:hypothetical protein